MPSSNGVYSLPPGYLAVTGSTILASQHNPPFEDVAAALTLRLSRDGTAPMTGALQAISGTAAAPAYGFAIDASTGPFKTTNGYGIAVGGVQVAEFTAAGMASGVWLRGQLIAWSKIALPSPLWVFPVGQTLSRTTYAALWADAQVEIAAGNVFYNNGDGSTTFGIGDLRGRVPAAKDNMGGTAANRLTGGGSGITGTTLGAVGGLETQTLNAGQIPVITSAGTFAVSPGNIVNSNSNVTSISSGTGGGTVFEAWPNGAAVTLNNATASGSVTSNNAGGGAHPNVQPTMVTNYILFAGGLT